MCVVCIRDHFSIGIITWCVHHVDHFSIGIITWCVHHVDHFNLV